MTVTVVFHTPPLALATANAGRDSLQTCPLGGPDATQTSVAAAGACGLCPPTTHVSAVTDTDGDTTADGRDVPTGPSIRDRLASGAADKPVLAVFVVVLVLLAVGFFVAGVVFVAEFLNGTAPV